jgi:antitoxin YefM
MEIRSYTAVRNDFANTMNAICEDHTSVIITRSNAPSVVMLSLDDYNAMQETYYLIKSPKNAKRLMDSINEIESMIAVNKKRRVSSRKKK